MGIPLRNMPAYNRTPSPALLSWQQTQSIINLEQYGMTTTANRAQSSTEILNSLGCPQCVPDPTQNLVGTLEPKSVMPEAYMPQITTNLNAGINLLMKYKSPIADVVDVNFPATILIKKIKEKSITFPFRTNKFIITAINKPQMEKYQVVETFGLPSLFFFDKRVSIYTIQGILMDSFFGRADNDPEEAGSFLKDPTANNKYMWAQAFQSFYEQELRATQLVEKNSIAILAINNYMFEGYPVNLSIFKESQQMNNATKFDMSWIIMSETKLADNQNISNLYKSPEFNKIVLDYEQKLFSLLQQINDKDKQIQTVADLNLSSDDEIKKIKELIADQKRLRIEYKQISGNVNLDVLARTAVMKTSEWD
jgi:hypothetical protein